MEILNDAPFNQSQLIIALIKDDLINTKLVSALNDLGIDANEYRLYICETIFTLMGFKDSIENDPIVEQYIDLTSQSRGIDFINEPKSLNKLAEKIYRFLNAVCPKPIGEPIQCNET